MAQAKRVNVAFTADTSSLKAGLQQANQALKMSRAQFEATTAGMQRWQTSTDGIRAKLTQLSSAQQAYTQKLNALRSQLQHFTPTNAGRVHIERRRVYGTGKASKCGLYG